MFDGPVEVDETYVGGKAKNMFIRDTVCWVRVVSGDFLVLLGPLLGIVFAVLALIASLMSDSYLARLKSEADKSGDGVLAFFTPFMVSVGLQVGALLLALIFRAAARDLPDGRRGGPLRGRDVLGCIRTSGGCGPRKDRFDAHLHKSI